MATDEQKIVTDFLTAGAESRAEDAIALLDPDCECWYTGAGRVTRDVFVNGMRALLAAKAGAGEMIVNDIIQEGNKVAIEYENIWPLKNGKLYHNHYQSKFVVENGKITVIREYLDSAHVADVLQGIAPDI